MKYNLPLKLFITNEFKMLLFLITIFLEPAGIVNNSVYPISNTN